jgi:general secretion pathway protein D
MSSRLDAPRRLIVVIACLVLGACATRSAELNRALQQARMQVTEGQYEPALQTLDALARNHAEDVLVRSTWLQAREEVTARLMLAAASARNAGRDDEADAALRRLLAMTPNNVRAQTLLLDSERERRLRAAAGQARKWVADGQPRQALGVVEAALKDFPRHPDLLRLQRELELDLRRSEDPTLVRLAETRPVSLEFRDANVRMVFEVMSRTTGVNFIIDRDVRAELRTTVFLRDTPLEDALARVASVSQLAIRVLDPTTVLVYPNTPDKAKEYQDLLIRGFYLTNADARQTGNLLRTMLKLRDVFVEEKLNLVVVRDTPEAIRLAERLVAMHDLTEPEVMLEVEVLEVGSARLLELGIQYPSSFSLTPLGSGGAAGGQLTLDDLRNVNSRNLGVSTPSVALNLRREVGDVNILANPKIRARNKEKARVLIGDRVPVITTTSTGTGFVSDSVQYLDVGIKLEVEPNVYFDDDVAIRVALEVSSLAGEVRTNSGLVAYQIGTRSANTTLRLRDGETQLLAGLISSGDRVAASRVPGLGDLPVLGRLFSNQKDEASKTEIVLSITPRLIRPARMPDANVTEFWSGTENTLRSRPLSVAGGNEAATSASAPGRGASATVAVVSGPQRAPLASGQPESMPQAPAAAPAAPVSAGRRSADVAAATTLPPTQALAMLNGPFSIRSGAEFDVTVRFRSDGGVRALPLQLAFDPARLQVIDVREGSFFKQGVAQTSFSHQVIANEGRVQITSQRRGADGVQGEGDVAVVRMRAVGTGSAIVRLQSAVALGVQGVDPPTTLGPALELTVQ